MDIEKLRSRPHLSASAINDYVECGLLYKLSRIDGSVKEFIPEALIFGSAVHEALSVFYKGRKNGITLSPEELIMRFERIWAEKAEGNEAISYKDGKDFIILLNEGKSLLGTYYKNLRDDHYRVLAVEDPFELTLDGLDIPVIGIIDLLEEDESGTLIITDHKTAGKSYTSDDVDKNFQLTVMVACLALTAPVMSSAEKSLSTSRSPFRTYWLSRWTRLVFTRSIPAPMST